jgi:hypothetical protein
MDVATFITKWRRAALSERAASQEHFLDLCRLLGQPTPAEHDATGAEYTFEKNVAGMIGPGSAGSRGDRGFADVWWKGKFGWEYKRQGKYRDLTEAYRQLCQYREGLDNPPLLIVSDINRIEIHTNFTGFGTEVHVVELDRLHEAGQLDLLRRVFTDPDSFRPDLSAESITQAVAKEVGQIAGGLRDRGYDPHDAAHFLMKVMFCLFAEDVALLPNGLFEKLLDRSQRDPARLRSQMNQLFAAMRTGGDFGVDEIAYFNGGLFDDDDAIELTEEEIAALLRAARQDWGAVEPSIFGTLFERSLDPSKRSQIGAHYTSREDIMLVIEPVIVRPLRRKWEATKDAIDEQFERRRSAKTKATRGKADGEIRNLLDGFLEDLASVRVLDPACGSGNFLYVAIQQLLALEKEVILFASSPEIGTGGLLPRVRPTQLAGIEINTYAAELAQVVIWIGYLQWMRDNGFNAPNDPILEDIATIENRDAILAWTDADGNAIPDWRSGAVCTGKAEWPEADFIVGNPPFLGTKMLRANLGDAYVVDLFKNYTKRIPNFSDLCCYWFELAREALEGSPSVRVGLLGTQAIRNGKARRVLERISETGQLFNVWSDRIWMLDGAAVQISIACFAKDAAEKAIWLDGSIVTHINTNLTTGVDVGQATALPENEKIAFIGDVKGGPFDIKQGNARVLLATPTPNDESPIQVIRPYVNGIDVTRRPRSEWVIDFGVNATIEHSAAFGDAFEQVRKTVKPMRDAGRPSRSEWWMHMRPCPSMREQIEHLPRYLATPVLTKYRLFRWLVNPTLPDHQLVVFSVFNDYFFGVLHSAIHEHWTRCLGTQLREAESGFRYTPTTCFETFPLPWPPGGEPAEGDALRPLHDAIAEAARILDEQRERWLNPPEWIAEIAAGIDAGDDFGDVAAVSGEEARRLIRQSAIDAAAAQDPRLRKRTLTKLYNERPTWLRLTHKTLDQAVIAAYAAVDPEGNWDASWAEVFVETGAGQPLPDDHELAERRAEVEQRILGNLLRMNLGRATA